MKKKAQSFKGLDALLMGTLKGAIERERNWDIGSLQWFGHVELYWWYCLTSIASIWRINMKNVVPQNQKQRLSLFSQAAQGNLRDLAPRNQEALNSRSLHSDFWELFPPIWNQLRSGVCMSFWNIFKQKWLGLEYDELVLDAIKNIAGFL